MINRIEQTNYIVFEIDNTQSHYAHAFAFINEVESRGDFKIFMEGAGKHFVIKHVRSCTMDAVASEINKIKLAAKIGAPDMVFNIIDMQRFISRAKNHDYYYYIRITPTTNSNVVEFSYYLLLLMNHKLPNDKIVCGVNAQSYAYFQRFSHFTKLLSNEYKKFFILNNGKWRTPEIPIDTYNLLPIIKIDKTNYDELIKRRCVALDENRMHSKKSILVRAINSIIFIEKNKICDAIIHYANHYLCLGKGAEGIKGNTNAPSYLQAAIMDVINNKKGISAVHYLLFAMWVHLFTGEDIKDLESANRFITDCYTQSFAYEKGVIQVLENAVQHSVGKKGILTARILDKSDKEYLSAIHKVFNNDQNQPDRFLQMIIADYNDNDTIIKSFLSKNKESAANLSAVKDQIQLSDFMDEYENAATGRQWIDFRATNVAKCQGLIIFAKAIASGQAVVLARSDINIYNNDPKNYWMRDFNEGVENQNLKADIEKVYIPGTQFNIFFPLKKFKQKGRYPLDDVIRTTFDSYARFLGWGIRMIHSDNMHEALSTIKQEWESEKINAEIIKKQYLWDKFTQYWNELYNVHNQVVLESENNKVIYVINMEVITKKMKDESVTWIESLCKGFLKSKWMTREKEKYIAFTYYDTNFANIFLSALSAARRGLENVPAQIFFSSGLWNDGNPDLIGPKLLVTERTLGDAQPKLPKGGEIPRLPWECFNIPGTTKNALNQLRNYAQREMQDNHNGDGYGYKLSDTHIKLGNKIHIDTFYEIAPHLMKQEIAKDIAFCLLQQLFLQPCFRKNLKDKKTHIYLYGYASYSRTIINAAHEMLSAYGERAAKVSFIIYQTKQAGTNMDYEEQIYISDPPNPGDGISTSIVQIVPISTTFTTFRKMWKELKRSGKISEPFPNKPDYNLTALWVRNELESGMNFDDRAKEEEPFWLPKYSFLPNGYGGTVETHDIEITGIPFYLLALHGKWRTPVYCEKCFPEALGKEFPLIKTDDSSTVPMSQYYPPTKTPLKINKHNPKYIASLKDFVKFGHISRGTNHYQFYIDMQRYYRINKPNIKNWLEGMKDKYVNISHVVIVSPHKTNNIEFAQYINDNCFKGSAHMLCLDSEKHYRSNVKLEFAEYMKLFNKYKFIYVYVDTSIITGQTYQRIASLMNTIANKRMDAEDKPFVFNEVFLLVDRLSTDTKRTFVEDININFHSFTQLNISNMRTYGDSCVGCKLHNDAKRYFSNAATKGESVYWEKKIVKNIPIFHEKWCSENSNPNVKEKIEKKRVQGFLRLIASHVLTERLHDVRGHNPHRYFETLGSLVLEFLKRSRGLRVSDQLSPYQYIPKDISLKHGTSMESPIVSLIKSLSRPFFSYDFHLKSQMADILMYFVMLILEDFKPDDALTKLRGPKMDTLEEKSALRAENKKWREQAAKELKECLPNKNIHFDFLMILLKALADMQMNFIFSSDLISNLNGFLINNKLSVNNFYRSYSRYIIRVVNGEGDEIKACRLEILLKKGFFIPYNACEEEIKQFNQAHEIMLLENNSALIHGVQILYNEYVDSVPQIFINIDTHLHDFEYFLKIQMGEDKSKIKDWFTANVNLFKTLKKEKSPSEESKKYVSVVKIGEKRYLNLCSHLTNVCKVYYHDAVLSLASHHGNNGQNYSYRSEFDERYFFVVPPSNLENETYNSIKELNNTLGIFDKIKNNTLNEQGYFIDDKHICIKLENNHAELLESIKNHEHDVNGRVHIPPNMQPVYLYITSVEISGDRYKALCLVRNLLMYRHHLIDFLEKDFNNNTMSTIAWYRRSSSLLAAQKADSHMDNDDLHAVRRALQKNRWTDDLLILLFHQNANIHIARMFRRMIECEVMQKPNLSLDFYPENRMERYDTASLTSLLDVFGEVEYLSESIKTYSGAQWVKTMLGAIDIYVGNDLINLANFQDITSKYQFLDFTLGTREIRWYCAERFGAFLLDFLFSAMKHGVKWATGKNKRLEAMNYDDGPAERYRYYLESGNKCKIWMKCEPEEPIIWQNQIKYRNLIIETIAKTEYIKKEGMSIPTARWYFDGLWSIFANYSGLYEEWVDTGPKAEAKYNNGKYSLTLPILK
ncbi:MAG: hypothetical protein FWE90_12910 [Defluviitaleaceae bacterium]|nr:hypothetical protein [Defluviitaleaceae bacterium]